MGLSTKKIDRLLLLSALSICGYASVAALDLCLPTAGFAHLIGSAKYSWEEKESFCTTESLNRSRMLHRLEQKGFIEIESSELRGNKYHRGSIRIGNLTPKGFALLTSTPYIDPDDDSWKSPFALPISFFDRSYPEEQITAMYLEGAASLSLALSQKGDADSHQEADFNSVPHCPDNAVMSLLDDGYITPSAYCNPLIQSVRFTRDKPAHRDRSLRLVNINTMFAACGLLGVLDKRPLFSSTAYGSLPNDGLINISPDSMEDYLRTNLTVWRNTHPESKVFTDPMNHKNKTADDWYSTAAYYDKSEILPLIYAPNPDTTIKGAVPASAAKAFRFEGIAVGANTVYVVHHTKPSVTWSRHIESTTISTISSLLNEQTHGDPYLGYGKPVTSAIVFTQSHYQFAAFFASMAKPRKGKKLNRDYDAVSPYLSITILPVNHSSLSILNNLTVGANPFQLRKFFKRLIDGSPGFTPNGDSTYPWLYNGKPVLLANDMSVEHIYKAYCDYERYVSSGKPDAPFYATCFPEHAKYLRQLMPRVIFL